MFVVYNHKTIAQWAWRTNYNCLLLPILCVLGWRSFHQYNNVAVVSLYYYYCSIKVQIVRKQSNQFSIQAHNNNKDRSFSLLFHAFPLCTDLFHSFCEVISYTGKLEHIASFLRFECLMFFSVYFVSLCFSSLYL